MSCCCRPVTRTTPEEFPALVRLDAAGNEVWASDCLDVVWDLAIDGSGNIWAAGSRGYDQQQFSTVVLPRARRWNDRASVVKLSPEGELLQSWDFGHECFCIAWNGTEVVVGNTKGISTPLNGVSQQFTPSGDSGNHKLSLMLSQESAFSLPVGFTIDNLLDGLNAHPDIVSGYYLPFTGTQISAGTSVIDNADPKLTLTDRWYPLLQPLTWWEQSSQRIRPSIFATNGSEYGAVVTISPSGDVAKLVSSTVSNSTTEDHVWMFSRDGNYCVSTRRFDFSETGFLSGDQINNAHPSFVRQTPTDENPQDWARHWNTDSYVIAIENASFGTWEAQYRFRGGGAGVAEFDKDTILARKTAAPLERHRRFIEHDSEGTFSSLFHTKPYFAVIDDIAYFPISGQDLFGYSFDTEEEVQDESISKVFEADSLSGIAGMIPWNGGILVAQGGDTLYSLNLSTGAYTQIGSVNGVIRCLSAIPDSTDFLVGGAYM